MSRHLIAASLVTSFLLAGCGAQKGTMVTAPTRVIQKTAVMGNNGASIISNNASRLAPTVGVIRGEAAVPGTAMASTLRMVGHQLMSEAELADDAESQGYSLMAESSKKSVTKTGIVRRTATGFVLETSDSHFFTGGSTVTDYPLIAGTTAITPQLNEHTNKKSSVRGLIDGADIITVTSVSSSLDLGFLTNWLTKGKIVGTVTNAATAAALPGAKVTVTGERGYVFSTLSDADGEFAVKTLEPGQYTVSIAKTGFQAVAAAQPETVGKRDKVKFSGALAPTP